MSEGSVVLTVQDLGVSFGGLAAVKGVSFEARSRRVTSVIGPNGAGKSTLFNLISGAVRPGSGQVSFRGADITGWPPNRVSKAGLARSFQITNLFFDLEVRENLRLAAQTLEPVKRLLAPIGGTARARAKVRELLERFELGHKAGELAGYLSHGEQRRLEVAVALASEPSLLLLDEPTQGMSHGDTADTERMIQDLSRDITVLLIEHDIELVMELSAWIVVMHQGQKLAEGPPRAIRANTAVKKAYLGEA